MRVLTKDLERIKNPDWLEIIRKEVINGKMLYLIGLGLDLNGISKEALEVCKKAKRIYIENYTVEFPYDASKLAEIIGNDVFPLTRIMVEDEKFVEEAKNKDVVLLVYGDPLTATTHISLILKCKQDNIEYRILHNASIFDAVCETGLQIYKFGKTASIPKWEGKNKPDSFIDVIKDNKKIKAHTLILVDIGLSYGDALRQLIPACRNKIKFDKMIVCSKIGTKEAKIYYDSIEELYGREGYPPFCFIIPSELHFLEEKVLGLVREKI